MTREQNNYLLGFGERIATTVEIKKVGGTKSLPYEYSEAKERIKARVDRAATEFRSLPNLAMPGGQVVGVITMHPRFVSKSDQPEELFDRIGLYSIGSRAARITPEKWGIPSMQGKENALTDEIFVAGTLEAFEDWNNRVLDWDNDKILSKITTIEDFYAYTAKDKLKSIPINTDEKSVFEVVLQHGPYDNGIIENFLIYLQSLEVEASVDRRREIGGLTFLPVIASPTQIDKVAAFSFVRVARGMPTLRPIEVAQAVRKVRATITLPESEAQDLKSRVVIFDGGIPENHALRKWVNCIEPNGIGAPVQELQEHGIAVTSSLLFGDLKDVSSGIAQPLCNVDHVRVLDENDGPDFMYTDVLNRILDHLDSDPSIEFVNISLGPNMAVDDHEVTAWTAQLDARFANERRVAVVAAGNDGDADPAYGLHRIQPPADGVNVIAVGSADQVDVLWKRADYSSMGPGRNPGIIKPDGLVFGGSQKQKFYVLNSKNNVVGVEGTSFAAPSALRQIVSINAQVGNRLNPLAIRALLIHRAENPHKHSAEEVGWGIFESDPHSQITCADDEAIVVYQGFLNPSQYLRAYIPYPSTMPDGKVDIRATLVTTPETDPAFATAYTRHGTELVFRPNLNDFEINEKTGLPKPAKTRTFFSLSKMKFNSETELRSSAQKWESCVRGEIKISADKLDTPVIDIYYHHRYQGARHPNPLQLPYAMIISIKAKNHPNLYNDIVKTYNQQLVPLNPQIRITI